LIEEAKYKEQLRQIEKEKKLKREETDAKKRIKEQIEADKRARKEKVASLVCIDVNTWKGGTREISEIGTSTSRPRRRCRTTQTSSLHVHGESYFCPNPNSSVWYPWCPAQYRQDSPCRRYDVRSRRESDG
jgi:hypothetical protein